VSPVDDYKKNAVWAMNVWFSPTHIKLEPSTEYVVHLRSRKVSYLVSRIDGFELGGNTTRLLLAGTVSVAMPRTSRDILLQFLPECCDRLTDYTNKIY
jgi:hypothetical protein